MLKTLFAIKRGWLDPVSGQLRRLPSGGSGDDAGNDEVDEEDDAGATCRQSIALCIHAGVYIYIFMYIYIYIMVGVEVAMHISKTCVHMYICIHICLYFVCIYYIYI